MHHEASLHEANSFVTLTYDDAHLPADGSLSKRAVQLFFKRFRKELSPASFRYFVAGEYGDHSRRAHYHAIIFGFGFPDRTLWRKAPSGHLLYRSALLERLWPFGNSEIGEVTHQSAGYVARYCLKKVTWDAEYYEFPHPVTGEFFRVIPEFALMSRRPALGLGWFNKWHMDAFPNDYVVIDGAKRSVPAFYKKKLSELEQLRITALRKFKARQPAAQANSTPERLAVREESQLLRAKLLKRELDNS